MIGSEIRGRSALPGRSPQALGAQPISGATTYSVIVPRTRTQWERGLSGDHRLNRVPGASHMAADDKVAHLGMLQSVISRLSTNSFLVKGWSITLVSALFALAAADTDRHFVALA